jgi:hypothetical protein
LRNAAGFTGTVDIATEFQVVMTAALAAATGGAADTGVAATSVVTRIARTARRADRGAWV